MIVFYGSVEHFIYRIKTWIETIGWYWILKLIKKWQAEMQKSQCLSHMVFLNNGQNLGSYNKAIKRAFKKAVKEDEKRKKTKLFYASRLLDALIAEYREKTYGIVFKWKAFADVFLAKQGLAIQKPDPSARPESFLRTKFCRLCGLMLRAYNNYVKIKQKQTREWDSKMRKLQLVMLN